MEVIRTERGGEMLVCKGFLYTVNLIFYSFSTRTLNSGGRCMSSRQGGIFVDKCCTLSLPNCSSKRWRRGTSLCDNLLDNSEIALLDSGYRNTGTSWCICVAAWCKCLEYLFTFLMYDAVLLRTRGGFDFLKLFFLNKNPLLACTVSYVVYA